MINNLQSLATCGDALLSDPSFGAVVVPQPFAYDTATPRIKIFSDIAQRHGKIACNVWLSEWLEGPGAEVCESDPFVAMFRSMERCFAALAAWHKRDVKRRAGAAVVTRYTAPAVAAAAAKIIAATDNATLTEREAKRVLECYGVPVVGEALVHDADAAVAAASMLGFPVALKVESVDLPHKTEAGVIRLDLPSEQAVRAAYAEVMANANKVMPPPRINGVLVQPMVPSGVEIMVGARIDPLFGPLLVVGLGGIFVELLKDSVIALAPVARDEALDMLDRLKGAAILRGFRGAEPVDIERLAEIICRISELVADQREYIAELDANPLICSGARIVAVDALIVKPV